jgi:hypothetical protein
MALGAGDSAAAKEASLAGKRAIELGAGCAAGAYTRSTFRLNVSALCGIGGAFRGYDGGV